MAPFAGTDHHAVYRIPWSHLLLLLRLPRRKRPGRQEERFQQLRRRPLVGCGEYKSLRWFDHAIGELVFLHKIDIIVISRIQNVVQKCMPKLF